MGLIVDGLGDWAARLCSPDRHVLLRDLLLTIATDRHRHGYGAAKLEGVDQQQADDARATGKQRQQHGHANQTAAADITEYRTDRQNPLSSS
ncbi:MAG: hypothetical protein R2849_15060 [Thermomicrobiales bacterium]